MLVINFLLFNPTELTFNAITQQPLQEPGYRLNIKE
jgi:hypothetical protein